MTRIAGQSPNHSCLQQPGTTSARPVARNRRATDQARERLLARTNTQPGGVQPGVGVPMPQQPGTSSPVRVGDGQNQPPASVPQGITNKRTVKKAETYLRRAGFNTGSVDGKISPRTERALRDFQQAVGRQANGLLDQGTLRHLQRVNQRIRKFDGRVLGPGQKSGRVRNIQQRLRKLGYEVGKADGVFDKQLYSAVKTFRRDDKQLRGHSGLIGKSAQRRLKQVARQMNHDPYRRRVKPSQKRKLMDRRVARAAGHVHADGSRGVGLDAKNQAVVKTIQGHLKAAGYDPAYIDGDFGRRTLGAVEQFQRRSNLPVTGRVDTRTWNKLQKATLEAKSAGSPPQRVGEHSAAVKRSEKLLKKLGVNPGSVDGHYTQMTQKAVDRFRRRHKLKGVGRGITDNTIKAMKRIYKRRKSLEGLGRITTTTGYVQGVARRIKVAQVEGRLVELSTAKAYLKMKRAASRDGVHLQINSGFRTMAEQQRLWNGWQQRLPGYNPAAPPGYSNHQSGVALDLNTQGVSQSQGTGTVYNWLARNAHKFGFQRIPIEHWHWEYQPGLRRYR